MSVVIFGAGRRGLRLASQLVKEKKNVTILDEKQERCQQALSKLDCMAICGSCTDVDKLIEAGCKTADAVVAVTDNDETNLVSCGIVASKWPNVQTIATVRTIINIGKESAEHILGIDHIVNPEQETAKRIVGIFSSRLFSDIINFKDAHFIMFTRRITNPAFDGKTLIDLKKEIPGQYLIAGVRRDGTTFTPTGPTKLKLNDEICIVADDDEGAAIYKIFGGIVTASLKRMIIIGATGLTMHLLNELPKRLLKNITLIEKDSEICKEFVDKFPQILVLNASITDEHIWEEENLKKSDLFISITDNDELNIITGSYAKRIGVKRAIALLRTNPNYITFASQMDIDAPISTTDVTVDALLKHLRGDGIEALHSVFNGALEVYEYVLDENFRELGKQLREVSMKKCIIAGVKRSKDENFIPNGFYTFKEGDTILVAAAHEDYEDVMEFFGK